ncbi:MAG: hypothetical protein ACRC10_01425 [Thermoguttaceae bacterium]
MLIKHLLYCILPFIIKCNEWNERLKKKRQSRRFFRNLPLFSNPQTDFRTIMSLFFSKIKHNILLLLFGGTILPVLCISGMGMTTEMESSGELPDPEFPWILTTAGEIRPGLVGKMTGETLFFRPPNDYSNHAKPIPLSDLARETDNRSCQRADLTDWGGKDEMDWETISRKNVVAILFRPPIDPDYALIWLKKHLNWPNTGKEEPGKDDQLLLVNNDRLAVQILSLADKKVYFTVSGVKKPLSMPIGRIRAIKFGQ